MKETTVMVSGQMPARGGQEIARRRGPTQEVAARLLQVAQPGYDSQPQANQYYRQPQSGYAQPQYYGQAQGQPNSNDGQRQPYYVQQQQNAYYPLQLLPIGLFRPLGQ